jgi:hypothetical protein
MFLRLKNGTTIRSNFQLNHAKKYTRLFERRKQSFSTREKEKVCPFKNCLRKMSNKNVGLPNPTRAAHFSRRIFFFLSLLRLRRVYVHLYEFLSDFGISCSMYLQFTLSLNDDGIF